MLSGLLAATGGVFKGPKEGGGKVPGNVNWAPGCRGELSGRDSDD